LLFPLVVFYNLVRHVAQGPKTIWSRRFLESILVTLPSLACATRSNESAGSVYLITGVLKHAFQLDLFSLFAMNVVLELLDHAVGVLKGVF
jgi:hypothetical protein